MSTHGSVCTPRRRRRSVTARHPSEQLVNATNAVNALRAIYVAGAASALPPPPPTTSTLGDVPGQLPARFRPQAMLLRAPDLFIRPTAIAAAAAAAAAATAEASMGVRREAHGGALVVKGVEQTGEQQQEQQLQRQMSPRAVAACGRRKKQVPQRAPSC